MYKEYINITEEPIRTFLDAVDSVLNSNTFLLAFDINTKDIREALWNFLNDPNFIQQLANQDKQRGWYNLHNLNLDTQTYELKKGNIVKDESQLKIEIPHFDRKEYLIAMLTGDTTKGRFRSFYHKQLKREIAEAIVNSLSYYLFSNKNWALYIVYPDFLKDAIEVYSKDESLRYFEGDYGNDNASILKCGKKGFLLLTNGID